MTKSYCHFARWTAFLTVLPLLALVAPSTLANDSEQPATSFSAEELEFFEKRVRPILVERCYECHAATSEQLHGGLQLDKRTGVLQGGDSGPAAIATKPEESLLIKAVGYDSPDLQMPPDGKLADREIQILTEWVRRGIPFPATDGALIERAQVDIQQGKKHWAFQPLGTSELPTVPVPSASTSEWPGTRIDPYIQAEHAQRGLAASAKADRRALLRRVKFDLLGLPPTLEELGEFERDDRPDAYARLIDQYLAAPQYGEQWGRYWLDLVRYCDVLESWREEDAKAWLYRDWVVNALNGDLPFDAFVTQQFAADLLPGNDPKNKAALGFLGLSPNYWKELKLDHLVIKQVVAEEWEERIEAITGTFLGLTAACARCHDHKFDPISTQDYYGLAGVLASVRMGEIPLLPDDQAEVVRQAKVRVKELRKEIETLAAAKPESPENTQKADELRKQIETLEKETPGFSLPWAFGVVDASLHVLPDGKDRTKIEYKPGEPQDVPIQIRGNASRPGAIVPRRFLAVLSPGEPRVFRVGSGRFELAQAIVGEAAALTSRVFVNRVWAHHFGRGLVSTVSNFGTQGDSPSHPELLDDLASRFIENGWSIKWLHREILLSETYQQSSLSDSTVAQPLADPDNIWLARMPLRRLEVEPWRDAILAATDELDLRLGGEAQEVLAESNVRRTLYGIIKRHDLSDLLRLYDIPDPVAHHGQRKQTTTPLQQLFVLNSPFMHQRSKTLAALSSQACPGDNATARIQWLYQRLFVRAASNEEVTAGLEFLGAPSQPQEDAWVLYCHALLSSNELTFVE